MARLCERPTCKREGTVVYGFDAVRLEVWFESPKVDQGSRVRYGLLCKEHADRMTVPLGWHLDDRRQRVQQLFRGLSGGAVDDESGERVHRKPRQRSGSRADATGSMVRPSDETLSLFTLDEPAVDVQPLVEREPVVVMEAEPEPEPEPIRPSLVLLDPSEPIVVIDASEPVERTDDDLYGDPYEAQYSDYDEYDGMDADPATGEFSREEGF